MSTKKNTTSSPAPAAAAPEKPKRPYTPRGTQPPKKPEAYRKMKDIKLADGTVVKETYHNQTFAKNNFPKPRKDPESGPMPKDEASKHQYPPPKKHPEFRKMWMIFIGALENRKNFKIAHLQSLEVLCDLYVDYDELSTFLRVNGQSYECVTRFGKMMKLRPEVAQIKKIRDDIRTYTKLLDLFPKKDNDAGSGGGHGSEWE